MSTTSDDWTARTAPGLEVCADPTLGGPPIFSRDGRWQWTGTAWEPRYAESA